MKLPIWNLAWSITNECNLRCEHCYASSGKAYKGELTTSEFREKLVDRAKVIGTKFFTITGGEPFIRPDIWEALEYIKSSGISLSIATNGVLLDKEQIKRLKNINVDRVQISLEGPTAELNNLIRGKGVFEKLTEKVIPELIKQGIFTAISMTPTNRNQGSLDEMVTLCRKLGVNSLSIRRFVPQGRANANAKIHDMERLQYRTFLEKVQSLKMQHAGSLKIASGDPLSILANPQLEEFSSCDDLLGGCTAGITSLAVSATGDIKACTRIDKILGNIKTDDLKQIWEEHPFLLQLRERNLIGEKCSTCKYKPICGGCRASALKYNGGAFQDDPNCWLETE